MAEWAGYVLEDFRFDFSPGSKILDVGCGEGAELSGLAGRSIGAFGIDLSMESLRNCRTQNLCVVRGRAEHLPFRPEAFDGIVRKVMLPYTDERATINEIGRVLRRGGIAYMVSHGAGYYLRYLLDDMRIPYPIYGARSMLNTWLWASTGLRLPGFLGDTIYQSRKRLLKHYQGAGLELDNEWPSGRFLGFPVFLYDRVKKRY